MKFESFVALIVILLAVYAISLMLHIRDLRSEHGQIIDKLNNLTTVVQTLTEGKDHQSGIPKSR